MPLNVPNILTLARVLAAPLIGILFLLLPRPLADYTAFAVFVVAALTDFFDGWLARRLNQVSAFGKMLDPIADKAMVAIVCAVLLGLNGLVPLLVVPILLILLREVLVSGLREYLGAIKLDVTQLAKWKTTVQLVALGVLLLASGLRFSHDVLYFNMTPDRYHAILEGLEPDTVGLLPLVMAGNYGFLAGLILLWVAAILTAITGWDYFAKAMPHLRAREDG
ncbi:MAG: CDP-diacylglycerol--glycerol-3-phosphate 3-phosphatidyltransferase [Pseudomonadota bacterium]